MGKPSLLVTVDVENWYNSRLFDPKRVLPAKAAERFAGPREDLGVVLDVLEKHGVRATFFVLGSLLEDFPQIPYLVERLGHEAGMHAYNHDEFAREGEFTEDLKRGLKVFREKLGRAPRGYRHPYFMINRRKLEILSGSFEYDASLVPSLHIPGHYGHPLEDPRPGRRGGIVELPLSVAPYLRLPAATGWYYRNIGGRYVKWIVQSSLKRYGYAQICLHSWEFTEKDRLEGVPAHVFRNCGPPMEKLVELLGVVAAKTGAETKTCLEYARSEVDCGGGFG